MEDKKMARTCTDCGAKQTHATNGGDLNWYECGSHDSYCSDGCCGQVENQTEACRAFAAEKSQRTSSDRPE